MHLQGLIERFMNCDIIWKFSKCNSNKQSQIRIKVYYFIGIYNIKKLVLPKNYENWNEFWEFQELSYQNEKKENFFFWSTWRSGNKGLLFSFQLTSSYTQQSSFHTCPKKVLAKEIVISRCIQIGTIWCKSVDIISY